jgi:hypothetical protein
VEKSDNANTIYSQEYAEGRKRCEQPYLRLCCPKVNCGRDVLRQIRESCLEAILEPVKTRASQFNKNIPFRDGRGRWKPFRSQISRRSRECSERHDGCAWLARIRGECLGLQKSRKIAATRTCFRIIPLRLKSLALFMARSRKQQLPQGEAIKHNEQEIPKEAKTGRNRSTLPHEPRRAWP